MSVESDLRGKLAEIFGAALVVRDGQQVPEAEDVTLGKYGVAGRNQPSPVSDIPYVASVGFASGRDQQAAGAGFGLLHAPPPAPGFGLLRPAVFGPKPTFLDALSHAGGWGWCFARLSGSLNAALGTNALPRTITPLAKSAAGRGGSI